MLGEKPQPRSNVEAQRTGRSGQQKATRAQSASSDRQALSGQHWKGARGFFFIPTLEQGPGNGSWPNIGTGAREQRRKRPTQTRDTNARRKRARQTRGTKARHKRAAQRRGAGKKTPQKKSAPAAKKPNKSRRDTKKQPKI